MMRLEERKKKFEGNGKVNLKWRKWIGITEEKVLLKRYLRLMNILDTL